MTGTVLGLLGVLIAITLPLFVEFSRRPRLRLERADDINVDGMRMLHLRVINEPLKGWRSTWLLRNDATGCRVDLVVESASDSSTWTTRGRWSAAPEPVSHREWDDTFAFDMTKTAQSYFLDLSPDEDGELIAIAVKHDGDAHAFLFSAMSYQAAGWRHEPYRLPHTEYRLTASARAGGIVTRRQFTLRNQGDRHTGLAIDAADL